MGIRSMKLEKKEDAERMMKDFAESGESVLLHAIITGEENVVPMVPAGKSLSGVIQEIK
jgi:thiamine pyrophosphate-dependent acetolactate synthase large subunit-like protein